MSELKPCPFCGGRHIDIEEENALPLWGYGIGCLNIDCEQGMVIRFALTRKRARKKAVRAWNRRAT